MARNGGDAGVAGMVGDHDRPKAPKRRNLLGIKPRRAVQSGNKDEGRLSGDSAGTAAFLFHQDERKPSGLLNLMAPHKVDFRALQPMFRAPKARADSTTTRRTPFYPWVTKPGFDARHDPN